MHQEVHRGRWARPLAVVLYAVGGLVVADVLLRGEGRSARVAVAAVLLAAALVYALADRPAVRVGARGVRLVNVVRDVTVPWERLADARISWSLVLDTDDGRSFASWAIGAGRPGAPRPTPGDPLRGALDPAATTPVADRGDAEAVRRAVLARHAAWRASGRPAQPDASVQVRWAVVPIGVVTAAAALLVAASLLG